MRFLSSERLVVVGGGQAAAQIIDSARREGYAGSITLVCDELIPPYQRPPLSKQFLMGKHDVDWLYYRPKDFYRKCEVDLLLGSQAVSLDRSAQRIHLSDGKSLPYDYLALTTGTRARRIGAAGSGVKDVFYIRSVDNVAPLREKLQGARDAVIIGAGFIGLEAAAVLVNRGMSVTLLAQGETVLPRVASAAIAGHLEARHRERGVSFAYQAKVTEIDREQNGRLRVICADGRIFGCDVVLVGIGAELNTELAIAAGLEHDGGIVVDEFARSSDPMIFAAGDCTNHPSGPSRRRIRLETVHNAVEQGRTAGATIAGVKMPYVQTPWVWSDQYDMRLQSVGLLQGHDEAVIRATGPGSFAEFYFADSQLIAATMINQPLLFGAVRRILNERLPITPSEAADPEFDIFALPASRTPLSFDQPWPRAIHQASTLQWGHD